MSVSLSLTDPSVYPIEVLDGFIQSCMARRLTNVTKILRYKGIDEFDYSQEHSSDTMYILHRTKEYRQLTEHSMNAGTGIFAPGSMATYYECNVRSGDRFFTGVVVFTGGAAFLTTMHSLVLHLKEAYIGGDEEILKQDYNEPLPPIDILSTSLEKPSCFICDQKDLYFCLVNRNIPLTTRILTAILNLFPYTATPMTKIATVMPFDCTQQTIGGQVGAADATKVLGMEATQFSLLNICILGPAYSSRKQCISQVAQRVHAAAAGLNIPCLNAAETSTLMEDIGWDLTYVPWEIREALGFMLCLTPSGTVDVEAPIAELATIEDILQAGKVTKVGTKILSQARIVYERFNSTDITFIEPVLPLVTQLVRENNTTLQAEIAHYDTIKNVVQNSPYMWMQRFVPDKYDVRHCPKLTYFGLLYHQQSIEDPEELRTFKEYKISDIRDQILFHERIFVETVVQFLPSPMILSMANQIKVLPLEISLNLLKSKDPKDIDKIYAILRKQERPGPWAEMMAEKKLAEYAQTLVDNGVKTIKKCPKSKNVLEFVRIKTMNDPKQVMFKREKLEPMQKEVLRQIECKTESIRRKVEANEDDQSAKEQGNQMDAQ